jgi:carboxyl-terminal processing protease
VENYYKDFANRYKNGELEDPTKITFPDSLKYYTANRRVVYGGGGIMPDVFIPWDSTPFSDYYMNLRRNNVIGQFVSDYVDNNRKTLSSAYPDFVAFNTQFVVSEDFMKEFLAVAEKAGVKFDEQGYTEAEALIRTQIKGLVAQKLWDLEAYYKVINGFDPEVVKAVAVMKDDNAFLKLKTGNQ